MQSTSPPTVTHGHGPNPSPALRFPPVWFVASSAAILAAPFLLHALLAARYREFFADFGVVLPAYTMLVLRVGGWIAQPAVMAGVVLAMIGLSVIAGTLIAGRSSGIKAWFAVIVTLAVAVHVTTRLALHVPLTQIQSSLNAAQPPPAPPQLPAAPSAKPGP